MAISALSLWFVRNLKNIVGVTAVYERLVCSSSSVLKEERKRKRKKIKQKKEKKAVIDPLLFFLGIEYPAIEENTSEFWPSGCPVCTDSCPCLRCLTHRTALPLPPSLADDITPLRTLVDDLLNSHLQQYGPFPKKRHPNSQPVRYVDPQEWKRDDFIESVIHGGVPVVLKGFSNDWDPKVCEIFFFF